MIPPDTRCGACPLLGREAGAPATTTRELPSDDGTPCVWYVCAECAREIDEDDESETTPTPPKGQPS